MVPRLRVALALSVLVAAAALGTALASQWYGGLVPCALCLVERWPYRIAIGLGLVGLVVPRPLARLALALVGLSMLGAAGAGGVHVGVENKWWPSPLPECAAPVFHGGTLAQRLASMPAAPSKSCEDPTFLIPHLPLSMAAMNMLLALVFAAAIAIFLWRTHGSEA
ncbi:MAG: disulfide bond formation protein B [Rhodospirillales bacterium]|nr:disulfide bond formation protein B [Rhodospirillales bacterium]